MKTSRAINFAENISEADPTEDSWMNDLLNMKINNTTKYEEKSYKNKKKKESRERFYDRDYE